MSEEAVIPPQTTGWDPEPVRMPLDPIYDKVKAWERLGEPYGFTQTHYVKITKANGGEKGGKK